MHGSDLHYVTDLLALENAVTPAAGHTSDIQKLRTIDHVVVWKRKLKPNISVWFVSDRRIVGVV